MKRLIKRKKEAIFCFIAISAITFSLLWPGDVTWGDIDQTTIISIALQANASQKLSGYHFIGSTNIKHHPFAIWIYQLLLLTTGNNLLSVIFIKQLLIIFSCFAGLYFLSKVLEYPIFLILIFFFSLPCYFLSRSIIEDAFLMVASLFLFVFYAAFHMKRSYFPLLCFVVSIILLIFIHPRGIVASFPFMLFFLIFEHRWIKKHWFGLTCIGSLFLVILFPYLSKIFKLLYTNNLGYSISSIPNKNITDFIFSLVTGGLWYSYDFLQLIPNTILKQLGLNPVFPEVIILATMLGYPLMVLGIIISIAKVIIKLQKKVSLALEDRFSIICIFTIIFHATILFFSGIFNDFLFYPAGIWFCSFFFIWKTSNELKKRKIFKFIIPVYLSAMMIVWFNMKLFSHSHGGYNLSNAIQISKTIADYSPDSNVFQLANLVDKQIEIADSIIKNSRKAFLGSYYKKIGIKLKKMISAQKEFHHNLLYESLVPLVYIYRQKNRSPNLPTSDLIIKKKGSSVYANGLEIVCK